MKSFDSNSVDSGSTKRARLIGAAATAAATAVLALTFVLDLDGCSGEKNKSAAVTPSNQNNSSASNNSTIATQPVPSVEQKLAVVEKKKAIKHASTATYKNSAYGVSFRYPKTYTMLTPEKDSTESAWPDPVAMNFSETGGVTLTTLVLPGTRATSYFKASVNKNMNAEQCGKFATTPEQSEIATNPPVDANDDSIASAKTNVLGVEFTKAENVTEQSEARYYHHFESGACYEFALGVEDAPNTSKPVDHLQVFDKLERIMTTVKIKPEPTPAVAVSTPVQQPAPASDPQQ